MSVGTIKPIATAADVESLPKPELQLQARAALAAGYVVDVRHIRYEFLIFANGKHFHPFTNWEQCVRLIVDTGSSLTIVRGEVTVFNNQNGVEQRTPTTDTEYRLQMCDAVVRNVAKGFPV